MPNIGPLEIAIVLIIALLVFGPKRLPGLGRSLGRGLTEFREGLQNIGNPEDEEEDETEEDTAPPPALESGQPADVPPSQDEPEVTEVTATGDRGDDESAATPDGEAAPDRKA
ncbi:MAG: twin-arginine translocase TatA/TatE family subunit [Solirubrobacterales bacterium]|nr:twin-arginine translocase TatA/TatE family subunit [Solirubrobacterales bacterium]